MKSRLVALNPGALIAAVLCVMVVYTGCKRHSSNPVEPDTTATTDTTHKSDTTHKTDTTHTSDSTHNSDTTHAGGHSNFAIDSLLVTGTSDTLNGLIAISGDGNIVACTSFGPFIYIFNANTGAVLNKISTFASGLQFNYSGSKLMVVGENKTTVYEAATGTILHDFTGYGNLTTTGDSVLLLQYDGNGRTSSLAFYSSTSGALLTSFAVPSDAWAMGLTKDSRYLIMNTGGARNMWLIDAQTGQKASTYKQVVNIYGGGLSPDGGLIAGFSRESSNAFEAYNTMTGAQLSTISVSPNDEFALFPDHTTMAISHWSSGNTASNSIVNIANGAVLRSLPGIISPYPWVRSFAMSDDGSRLIGAFWNSVRVWKLR